MYVIYDLVAGCYKKTRSYFNCTKTSLWLTSSQLKSSGPTVSVYVDVVKYANHLDSNNNNNNNKNNDNNKKKKFL